MFFETSRDWYVLFSKQEKRHPKQDGRHPKPEPRRETGMLLRNIQRQHRTVHIQKGVMSYAL